MLIVFGVLAGSAVLFVSNRVRSDLVGILVALALMVSGVLTVPEALAGFSEPVVILIVAMFVVSEALVNTGIAPKMGELLLAIGRGSEMWLVVGLMLAASAVGAFMSSTAVVAIFVPVVLSIANKAGLNPKRLLMPLSVGALISGMMTLIATAPNLVVQKALNDRGLENFGFFSFSPFGLAVLLLAIAFMLLVGRDMLSRENPAKTGRLGRSATDIFARYGLVGRISRLRISPESALVDRAVARMQLRQNFDVTLLGLERQQYGKRVFLSALPETVFKAGDGIFVHGSEETVSKLMAAQTLEQLPALTESERREAAQQLGVAEIMITPESELLGHTLSAAQFRSRFNVTVLAVHRRGESLSAGLGDFSLDFGDALLVLGAWPDILRLREERDNFVVITLPDEFREIIPARRKAPWAIAILTAMVALMALEVLANVTAALLSAVALIVTRCVKIESVYRSISWQAVVLVAGILPLATALTKTGAAHIVAEAMVKTLGSLGPFAMLAFIFLITAGIGSFMSNTATAVLIAPIAIDAALSIGVSPQAFAMTVAIASSAAYVTPVASPVNTLVLEPGGYSFIDFVKVGLPLLFLTLVITVLLAGVIYLL